MADSGCLAPQDCRRGGYPGGSPGSPYQVARGERDIHQGRVLEMVRVVDREMKNKRKA